MYIRTIKTRDKREFDFEVNRYCELVSQCKGKVRDITISHPKPYFPDYVATIIFNGCTEADIEECDNRDIEHVSKP